MSEKRAETCPTGAVRIAASSSSPVYLAPVPKNEWAKVANWEAQIFGSEGFSAAELTASLTFPFNQLWRIEAGSVTYGYAIVRLVSKEAEWLSFAVLPEHRRAGWGRKLGEALLTWLKGQEIREVFLEVRAGNRAAIELYRQLGFREFGRRKKYYRAPVEDALLMKCRLAAAAPGVVGASREN